MSESLHDYDYALVGGQIAQTPPRERGDSRLLVLERAGGSIRHRKFSELPEHLKSGDLLVLNETRVFPARLRARRRSGGRVEVLLLEVDGEGPAWKALGRPARSLRDGEDLLLEGNAAQVRILGRNGATMRVEVRRDGRALEEGGVIEVCDDCGETPLPPYIQRETEDPRRELDPARYQTVYARTVGAVAAPTAGLHFTEPLLQELETRGVQIARIALHVGLGTFQPLTEDGLRATALHEERISIDADAGTAIIQARKEGRRTIAVGTTCVRALESFLGDTPLPYAGRTDLFIKPGYSFRGVDALITNFHLPKSSPLVLASAFAGRQRILAAYDEAMRLGYRFYSYGDAMLIV